MSKFSSRLLHELEQALDDITFGSIEIYVQDKKVTQITVRNIKKTSVSIKGESDEETGQLAYRSKTKVFSSTITNERVIEN